MLALVTCLLLATSAMADDYGTYMGPQSYQGASNYDTASQSSYPMDYNDDFRAKPHSNIYFSFEQLRKDQPPQVEIRDEDVGRYMYRRTTTTPAPLVQRFKDLPERRVHSRYPEMNVAPVAPQRYSEINVVSTTMAPPPPPPSPKWQDISWQPYSQYHPAPNYHAPREHRTENHFQPRPVPTTPAPAEWSGQTQDFSRHVQPPTYAQRAHEVVPPAAPSLPQWPETATESFVPRGVDSIPQSNRRSTNRGSHKYNWSDTVTELTTSAPVHQPNANPKGPPPPVPTLTPWQGDHF